MLLHVNVGDTEKTSKLYQDDFTLRVERLARMCVGRVKADKVTLWNVRFERHCKEPVTITGVPGRYTLKALLPEDDNVLSVRVTPFVVRPHNKHQEYINDALAYVQHAQAATFNARGVGKSMFTSEDLNELVAKRLMQATNPPDNPAQPNEQSRSQSTEEGNTTMSQVNHAVPVQTLTFVFGQRIDLMGKPELFTAAQAVASQINGLKKSNESVGSVAIQQEIDGLEKDLVSIRTLMDNKFAAQTTAGEAVVGAATSAE